MLKEKMQSVRKRISKGVKPFDITENDIAYCNRCDMLQLAVWFSEESLLKQDNYLILKNKPDCYVIRTGVYSLDGLLDPPFAALQKHFNLNMWQSYIVCSEFMKKVDKSAIRKYCSQVYGQVDMPYVPKDLLNYVVDESILYREEVGLKTIYGILADAFHIDREVINQFVMKHLITVDEKFNICFNDFDTEGNVVSSLKLSRYKHSNEVFSYNLYTTTPDPSFSYSKYPSTSNTTKSLTVFDNPVELLSYLSLEQKYNTIVPELSSDGYFLAMYNSNLYPVQRFLRLNKVDSLNMGIKLTVHNARYVTKYFNYYGKVFNTNCVVDLQQCLRNYMMHCIKNHPEMTNYRIDGWNSLLKILEEQHKSSSNT